MLLNISGCIIIIFNQDVDAKNLFDTFVVFEVKIFMNIYIFWYNFGHLDKWQNILASKVLPST